MKFERFYSARDGEGFAFGTHCWSSDTGLYEMCGKLGYDYVWIDNEHGGMTYPMICSGICAVNAGGSAAIVRVPGHEMEDVKPVLEMGPQGVVFPMVNTAEQAEKVVRNCLYPPKGIRSWGPLRGIDYYETNMEEYLHKTERETLRFLQCEHVQSVRNLGAILEVPGVDVIICGPNDLSGSVGKLGRIQDPEVTDLMNTIIKTCREAKKPFGVSVGNNWPLAKFWLEQGASFVSAASVYDYFSAMSHQVLGDVGRLRQSVQ